MAVDLGNVRVCLKCRGLREGEESMTRNQLRYGLMALCAVVAIGGMTLENSLKPQRAHAQTDVKPTPIPIPILGGVKALPQKACWVTKHAADMRLPYIPSADSYIYFVPSAWTVEHCRRLAAVQQKGYVSAVCFWDEQPFAAQKDLKPVQMGTQGSFMFAHAFGAPFDTSAGKLTDAYVPKPNPCGWQPGSPESD
jgi:hypothetical protein